MHDAFTAAVEQWPRDGIPANPRAWLVSTGRFKSISAMRKRARFDASLSEIAERLEAAARDTGGDDEESLDDDRLRLIFTCCHPALTPDAQIALTLREVCGLTTEEIASAFFTSPSTVAQRIVRAKAKIRDAAIPYQVPPLASLADRLDSVLHVVYLVFNEGYFASSGESLTRHDLSGEAIRLGRLLTELLPEPEAIGLLGLMLLHESRRAARTSADGELILLADQDRDRWNRGSDRGRIGAGRARLDPEAAGSVHPAGGDRRGSCRGEVRGGDRLGADRRSVRHPRSRRSGAGGRVEPRGRRRHARWPAGRSDHHRRDSGARRSRRLPARALGARRFVPPARPGGRRARVVSARAGPHASGAGAPLPRAAAGGARDTCSAGLQACSSRRTGGSFRTTTVA